MNDVTQLTGSPVMWLFSGLIVAAAIFQSAVLYRMAKRYVRRTGVLTEEEMRVCMKAGGTVAIGPAISVFVVALSMISMLGAPFTLMRVDMIGSAVPNLPLPASAPKPPGFLWAWTPLPAGLYRRALVLCGDERRLPDLWAAGHPGGGQGPEPGGHPAE